MGKIKYLLTYVSTSFFFTTTVSFVSFDVSRSNGSMPGRRLTVVRLCGINASGFHRPSHLGAINSWTTVSLNFAGINKVVLDGSGEESASQVGVFSPYGIDNLQFSAAAAVPEPLTLWLLGAGLIGLAGISRRQPK